MDPATQLMGVLSTVSLFFTVLPFALSFVAGMLACCCLKWYCNWVFDDTGYDDDDYDDDQSESDDDDDRPVYRRTRAKKRPKPTHKKTKAKRG